jgi:cytidyltransferase-like protein
MKIAKRVIVSGGFDDIRARDLRFLEESARFGPLTVLLWNDRVIEQVTGNPPRFPLAERDYVLNGIRFVDRVIAVDSATSDSLPDFPGLRPEIWADIVTPANPGRNKFCRNKNMLYHVFKGEDLAVFPESERGCVEDQPQHVETLGNPADGALSPRTQPRSDRKKVVATGCFDWIHSGHVRFCEELSAYGDLYIIVGHDRNIRLLKGEGHPLFPQEERRYLVGSIKYVKQALISTGEGWLDADPEIRRLKPDIYAVNEDGDKGGKREYCQKLGIEYLVLKRVPAPGLSKRSSTDLRGF